MDYLIIRQPRVMSKLVVDTDSLVEVSQRHGGIQNLVEKLNVGDQMTEELSVDLPEVNSVPSSTSSTSSSVPSALVDQIVKERVSALMEKENK